MPDIFENTIFGYELACTNHLRVVLIPCAPYCPCEALEQKWAKKQNFQLKEIEPRLLFDSSRRADNFSVFVCQNRMKNDQVITLRWQLA